MKIHYFFFEILLFFSVFFGFILPSILNNHPDGFTCWNFPFTALFSLLCSIPLCFIESFLGARKINFNKICKRNLGLSALALILLFLISTILQFAAYFADSENISQKPVFPQNVKDVFFCIITFFFSASFEELIFRYYIPEAGFHILKSFLPEKNGSLTAECSAAVLFALCHRYLGFFAVFNALFAHFVLRFCFKKTDSILFSVSVHFIYNIITLFILFH
jgi:membrane protease YdiL (CAAX protease family)